MSTITLEGKLRDSGFEYADRPGVQIIRSKKPLEVGAKIDISGNVISEKDIAAIKKKNRGKFIYFREILGLLRNNSTTFNHIGEGPYAGVAWTPTYAEQIYLDAMNRYKYTVNLIKRIDNGFKIVSVSYLREDRPEAEPVRKDLREKLGINSDTRGFGPYEPAANLAKISMNIQLDGISGQFTSKTGLFNRDGTPIDDSAREIEKELFN